MDRLAELSKRTTVAECCRARHGERGIIMKLQRQTRCAWWSSKNLDGDSALGNLQPCRIAGGTART